MYRKRNVTTIQKYKDARSNPLESDCRIVQGMGGCLALVGALWSIVMTVTLGSLIKGPETMSVVAPIGGPNVAFTCIVNTTDLPANTTFFSYGAWIVSGDSLPFSSGDLATNGSLEINTLQLPVIPDYITGVPVLCQIVVRVSGVLMDIRSTSATLTAYGKI